MKKATFLWLLLFSRVAVGFCQDVQYLLVPPDVIETRLSSYSRENGERLRALHRFFEEAGCGEPHLTEQPAEKSKLPNLVCVLPGNSERTIIVGAHFDHSGAGDGVVDNWSGASLLVALYQSVRSHPRIHSYVFIGFAAEEKGLLGSRSYARNMSKEQVSRTDAMVNLDTLGLTTTRVSSRSDRTLTNTLALVARSLNFPLGRVNIDRVGSSDAESFEARKIATITVHSLTQQSFDARILHSPRDKLSAVKLEEYYQSYCLLAAYLAFLDQLTPDR